MCEVVIANAVLDSPDMIRQILQYLGKSEFFCDTLPLHAQYDQDRTTLPFTRFGWY
jgi:hypothetical protein